MVLVVQDANNIFLQFAETADDRFIVYGKMYTDTRDALAQALMSANVDDFVNIIKVNIEIIIKIYIKKDNDKRKQLDDYKNQYLITKRTQKNKNFYLLK